MRLLIQLTAHFCVVTAIALGLAHIIVIALHCRPLKYNYMIPIENPRHCFRLKPYVVAIVSLGVVLDALIWCLPHYVVWHLNLRLSHKLAVSVMFAFGLLCDRSTSVLVAANTNSNIFIGGLRANALADVAYQGDVTYGIGTTLMWAIAQMSTGIIVACCLYLRPLFECLLPRRFTHLTSRISKSASKSASKVSQESLKPPLVLQPPVNKSRAGSITVTTAIAVEPGPVPPPAAAVSIHDGQVDTEAPTFDVEAGPARRLRVLAYCCGGSSRGCGCLC
jgi:hypothetical protein